MTTIQYLVVFFLCVLAARAIDKHIARLNNRIAAMEAQLDEIHGLLISLADPYNPANFKDED